MSSVTVIIGIVILLSGLVCYAFVTQTIKQKQEKHKRVLTALKSQYRNFSFMLNGCPDGFLTPELKIIVLKSLIEVCNQLSKLEPQDKIHVQSLQERTKQLADTQREKASSKPVSLQSAQQVKEVKMCLEELHRFIFNLEGQNRVTRQQADMYRTQIKQLVLQITVDGYTLNAEQAQQSGKAKLAIHYFTLAISLFERENKHGKYSASITLLKDKITELESMLTEEERQAIETPNVASEEQAELDEAWDKFGDKNEDMWKKKQVYD